MGRSPDGGLPYFTTEITKQKKRAEIQVPMTYELWKMLMEIIGERKPEEMKGPVFLRNDGKPLRNPPHKALRRLKEETGMAGKFEFHCFRKSLKMRHTNNGFSTKQTAAIQGHATESMDRYYTVFQRTDLERMVNDTWPLQRQVKAA